MFKKLDFLNIYFEYIQIAWEKTGIIRDHRRENFMVHDRRDIVHSWWNFNWVSRQSLLQKYQMTEWWNVISKCWTLFPEAIWALMCKVIHRPHIRFCGFFVFSLAKKASTSRLSSCIHCVHLLFNLPWWVEMACFLNTRLERNSDWLLGAFTKQMSWGSLN